MCICTLKHSLFCVECRVFISVPLGASIKRTWQELKGNFLPPFGTGSKSATKICTSFKTYTRPWTARRDPSALLLSVGLLLCFLSACHWYSQHPGDKLVLQPTEASWSRDLLMYFSLVLRNLRAWHCSKGMPQACLPCRDSALKGGSVPSPTALGKVSQSHLPSLCSQEALALWGAWCGNKPAGVRLGADVFLQFSSESFLFCSFFCQCWSYSFSVHAKLPQREKQISW